MKWLLITTVGRNPGDEFARMGVQAVIRCVDQNASFELLDKETETTPWKPREFDYCVLCGMPLFWDNEVSWSQSIWWWKEIFSSWPTQDRDRFLVLGVGDVFSKPPVDMDRYIQCVSEVIGKSACVTTRTALPYLNYSQTFGVKRSICPAAFVNMYARGRKELKLCNFMREGAHDPHFNPVEAEVWKQEAPKLATRLVDDGFEAICHTKDEADFALELGFKSPLLFGSVDEYAAAYSVCKEYIGNRMHGAVITLGGGGSALAIGYDSRVEMVKEIGGATCLPSELAPAPLRGDMRRIGSEFFDTIDLVKRITS